MTEAQQPTGTNCVSRGGRSSWLLVGWRHASVVWRRAVCSFYSFTFYYFKLTRNQVFIALSVSQGYHATVLCNRELCRFIWVEISVDRRRDCVSWASRCPRQMPLFSSRKGVQPLESNGTVVKGEVAMAAEPQKPKLVFHCQQAQGSPTGLITGFSNVKELYQKISECYDFPADEVSFGKLFRWEVYN